MNSLLVFAALGSWHSVVVHSGNPTHTPRVLMVDSMGCPVITGDYDANTMIARWRNTTWQYEFPSCPHETAILDSYDFLWLERFSSQRVEIFREGFGWDTLMFYDTDSMHIDGYSCGFVLDTLDRPHLFFQDFNAMYTFIGHAYYDGSAWIKDTLRDVPGGEPRCGVSAGLG